MVVYIEYVLLNNFLIDYFLLKTTFLTTGKTVKRIRLVLCAVLGASFSLLYPLLSVYAVLLNAIKIAFGLLLILLASTYKSVREYYITALLFFFYTFLTGGAVIGVYSLLDLDYSSELAIGLMAVPVYFVVKVAKSVILYIYKGKEVKKLIYKTELMLKDKTVKVRGFLDTGNAVYDGVSPVIFADKKTVLKLWGKGIPQMKYVAVTTVVGEDKKLSLKLDCVRIYKEDEPNIYLNVTLCVSDKGFGENYEVILHPALFDR